jgi:hypothetical protein
MLLYPCIKTGNELSVQIIPNPAYGGTTIKVVTPGDGEVNIRIFGADGRSSFTSGRIPVRSGVLNYYWNRSIENSDFARPGVYFCQVRFRSKDNEEKVVNTKMVLLDF